jgi:hypothetical protein
MLAVEALVTPPHIAVEVRPDAPLALILPTFGTLAVAGPVLGDAYMAGHNDVSSAMVSVKPPDHSYRSQRESRRNASTAATRRCTSGSSDSPSLEKIPFAYFSTADSETESASATAALVLP